MPRLVILNQSEGMRVFDLAQGKTIIGRGEDADLMLPNISVSRHHAQVLWNGEAASIEDLESSNGTFINGTQINGALLTSGDEIVLGKFTLAYKGDGPEDRFYKGRYLEYMVKYNAELGSFDDSTFAMTPAQIQQMQNEANKMRNARLVLLNNTKRYWHPEDQALTFGDGGMIMVDGMFTGGIVAEVKWDSKRHVLTKKARLLTVQVNETAVSNQPLRNGDRIRIGNSIFRYEFSQE
jgi:predicted component of type VI protein secretion system